ncbi:hypothetical protein CRG98_020589 [Punica granatum]|uniref:DUF630 domain-containing protein n=1 Tax=Punica granatum TaxID=22663 RepID=A0A2I0JS10_PUNGR|nr:hypothetical protein CRG98_020589 [Punica granatum]
MGCVASRTIDKEERVQTFKERRRLMKQLLVHRGEFSDALLAYLRALKNTGVTLRQFTESESLEIEDIPPDSLASPSSPPPPLPPSPPPPPHFSPERKAKPRKADNETGQEESIEINEDDDGGTPPPPPVPSSSWDFWDPFKTLSPQHQEKKTEHLEEEHWAETRTEFEEECAEEIVEEVTSDPLPEKPEKQPVEMIVDDSSSSVMSWNTKRALDMRTMVAWSRSKKTLEGIVKDLDDYFLKASALGKEIAILVDINSGDVFPPQNFNKRKRSNSAKVFSALSWSWSSKSLQLTREASDCSNGPSEPCRPGAHCITLEKIFAAEQRLHKDVKGRKGLGPPVGDLDLTTEVAKTHRRRQNLEGGVGIADWWPYPLNLLGSRV